MTYEDILPGHWHSVVITDGMIAMVIREWRTKELSRCDWTQLPDVDATKVDVAAWRVYRQELRDMMSQSDDPKQIVFPTPPE